MNKISPLKIFISFRRLFSSLKHYDSLEKGIKDISQTYNNDKINRPKISLLCNYYCDLGRTPEEENYMINELEALRNNLKKELISNY